MDGKIIVVTHKDYDIPSNKIYFPICVGKEISKLADKFQPDNVGENISAFNSTYCELTAIYWAWKNMDLDELDYIGVAHYRRHFSTGKQTVGVKDAVSEDDIASVFREKGKDIVITPVCKRYLSTVEHHYINSRYKLKATHKKDIFHLRKAVQKLTPEYEQALNEVLMGRNIHMLNMFIMNTDHFKSYCEWLFLIIHEVVKMSKDRINQNRYAGALSEFMLDVWIKKNGLSVFELKLLELEKPSYLKKIKDVVMRNLQ